MSERYFVINSTKGYYADKQPHYEWSFTDDFWKAKMYKNEMSCWKWLFQMYNNTHSEGLNIKLLEVEIEKTTSSNSNETSSGSVVKSQKEVPFRFNKDGWLIYPEHIVAKIKGKKK